MKNADRIVISKSKKRRTVQDGNIKTLAYTEMVVYKTKLDNGKHQSFTRHEPVKN